MVRKVSHRTISQPQRFRLVQDNSSHWYAIPADQRVKFEEWMNTFGWGDHEYHYKGPDFSEYRLNMHPSNYMFTDLKEDK
jgi:hypothetical protein